MIANRWKRTILIIFAFLGSHLISYIIDPYSEYWLGYFDRSIVEILTGIIISLFFYAIISELSLFTDRILNTRMPWIDQPIKRLIFQSITQVIIVLIVTFIPYVIVCMIYGATDPTIGEIRVAMQWTIAIILMTLIISAINTGNFLISNWKSTALEAAAHKLQAAENEVKAAQHKQAAAEAELQALRLQLDNHFVFNNLSVLSELILVDQQLGYQYAENFTKVYRYLLVNSKKNLITLEEELKFIDAYLFLIKERIGDGVVFEIDVEKRKLGTYVPPLSIQLLIENALKHNRTVASNPLNVRVYTDNDELAIKNTILPLVKRPESSGIGLKNIISRYELISERKPAIEQCEHFFTVKIPLIENL